MLENETDALAPGSEIDHSALPVGASIGRFVVTSILGQGGFGITYRARDEQLGRDVAIKEYLPVSLAIRQDGVTVLPRSTKAVEDFTWGRERFVAEGRTLVSLHDAPSIVRVFDFLELNGTAYIVMELVRGETLEDRIRKKGKLTADEVLAILWPLLDGLEQVHKAGFLHRDIKPANILLREDGRPTMIDFGASRAAMAGRTMAMTAIFTPGYAAAEQMTAAKQGPWTDIYGLSATLYHAITGATPPSAFDRMLDDEYVPLTRLAPTGFPPGLLIGLDVGLGVRAADRPQTIAGWRSLLDRTGAASTDATVALGRGETVLMTSPGSVPAPSSASPTAPAKNRTGLVAALGAAAVLVLGGGGWLLMGSDRAAPKPVGQQEAKVDDQGQKAEVAHLREELEAQKKAAAEQRELADAQAKRAAAEEARRKIEGEMAAQKAAEDEARRKVAVETEAKRLADEALAKAQEESQKAAAAARQKAEADAKLAALPLPAEPPPPFTAGGDQKVPRPAAYARPLPASPLADTASRDGLYRGTLYSAAGSRPVQIRVADNVGSAEGSHPKCGPIAMRFKVGDSGELFGEGTTYDGTCKKISLEARGRIVNNKLELGFSAPGINSQVLATRVSSP